MAALHRGLESVSWSRQCHRARVFQAPTWSRATWSTTIFPCSNSKSRPRPLSRASATVNPSYSDLITPIVSGSTFLFESQHDNKFYDMVGKLTGDYYTKQKRISLLSKGEREKIQEYFRPQNEAVCRKYFPGRPKLFDQVDHNKYDYLTTEEFTRRQLQFLASLVFGLYQLER